MSNSDFRIIDGVLKKYTGKDKSVIIPDGVTSIGEYAFRDCIGLKNITILGSTTSIAENAFEWCNAEIIFAY